MPYRIKSGFVLRQICGETVLFGEGPELLNYGQMICLNETAAWLWEHATGDFTVEQLAEALTEEYDVSPELARKDVEAIVRQWKELGLIE